MNRQSDTSTSDAAAFARSEADVASSRRSSTTRHALLALPAVFFVSGFCGLIYESIWSHYLKLFVGHAAYAQTVVLVVFIGGLALGAYIVGRRAERIRQPLLAYAIVEAIVGIISLVFHGIFVGATAWAFDSLLPQACTQQSACVAQWVVAALLILPQSILLGSTFPLMTAGILRIAPDKPGERIALLYFLNSLGAVVGVLASGFILIPAVGLPGALMTAGLLNIAVALAAYMFARAPRQQAARWGGATMSTSRPMSLLLLLVAGLTGLSSFIYEIAWIRMLSLVTGASTHSFELMLAAFILGLALGGAWIRRRIDRLDDVLATLAIVQILMGVAAVATFPIYVRTFDFLAWLLSSLNRTDGGYLLYNIASHLVALAVMLPATILAGMTLPLITAALLLRSSYGEKAIGLVYSANTFGAIVGIVVAVHFALGALGLKGALLLGGAIDVALGAALMLVPQGKSAPRRGLAFALCGLGAMAIVAWAFPIGPERLASGVYRHASADLPKGTKVLYHEDGKTSTITVVDTQAARSIRTNGKPDAAFGHDLRAPSTDEYTMTLAALLPLAHRPGARDAAVIGFGSGMTTATLLASPTLRRVDTIEIEAKVIDAARHFGSRVQAAYEDPRSRIVIDDAKSYFSRGANRYDIIVSEPSNPWVSGVASLFTREFYARVKRHLDGDGIFVQWLQAYEFDDALMATIFRALDAEFAHYVVYAANDGDMIIVASSVALAPLAQEPFESWPAMKTLLQRFALDSRSELEWRRLAGRPSIRSVVATLRAGENSDYFPVVDQLAPVARFRQTKADLLIRLAQSPVPVVEMLEGRAQSVTPGTPATAPFVSGGQRGNVTIARNIAAFVSAQATLEPSLVLPRDTGLLRAILWDCAAVPPRVEVSALLLEIAGYVNAALSGPEATEVWRNVRNAPCASRLDAAQSRWLDLFEATAQRSATRMSATGLALLKHAPATPPLLSYALMATSTGMITEQRYAEAEALLGHGLAALPADLGSDPAFTLLLQRAREGQRVQ